MKNDFNQITQEYIKGINSLCDPLYVVLYGSSSKAKISSDMDVFTIVKNTNEDLINDIADFTIGFHEIYGLMKDFDIPYDKKTVYSYDDIKKALSGQSFIYKYGKFLIPSVRMSPDFLGSDEMRYRLFLNAMTTQNLLLHGDPTEFEKIEKKCRETMIRVIFSQKPCQTLSINDIYGSLMRSHFDGSEGVNYLGYKEKNSEFLQKKLQEFIEIFSNEGKIRPETGGYKISYDRMKDLVDDYHANKEISNNNQIKEPSKQKIDFLANKNPIIPTVIQNKDLLNISDITEYPDYTNNDINHVLSQFLGIGKEHVSVCQGSLDAIYNLPKCMPFDEAIIIEPTYWGYEDAVKRSDLKLQKMYLNQDLSFDLNHLDKQISEKKSLVFICNPNNPTGTYIEHDDMFNMLKKHPNAHFILDETHLLFDNDFDNISFKKHITEFENLSIVFSLSKFFNIPGVRIGAFISNPLVVDKFKTKNTPYYIDNVSKTILKKSIEDGEFIAKSRKELIENKEIFFEQLNSIGYVIPIYNKYSNFFICKIADNRILGKKIERFLLKKGLMVRSCEGAYDGLEGDRLRISVNSKENNQLLIDALKQEDIYKFCSKK